MPAHSAKSKSKSVALVFGKGSIPQNPYLKSLGLAALVGIVLLFLLNFLNITPFSKLFFGLESQGSKVGILSSDLALFCPVEKGLCGQGKTVTFNGNTALAYKLEPNTRVSTVAPVADSKDFSTDPFEKNGYKGVWQTSLLGEDCYTFTYLFPKDAGLRVSRASLGGGETLGYIPPSFFKAGGEDISFILQVQKRTAKEEGQPQTNACALGNRQPREFGEYLKIDPSVFR